MKYKQDSCLKGGYFKCLDTSIIESEPKKTQPMTASQDLPLDTSFYHTVQKQVPKAFHEQSEGVMNSSLDTSRYKISTVRKLTYRVTKK